MSRARAVIRLAGRYDGTDGATVTITDQLFTVRPARRRRTFTLLLSDVARRVIFDVVRAELWERDRKKRVAKALRRRR